jgi:hypothetical protein
MTWDDDISRQKARDKAKSDEYARKQVAGGRARATSSRAGATKDRLRDEAIAGRTYKVDAAKGALARHEDAAIDSQRNIKYGVAKGFASGSDPMVAGGGGAIAAAGQLGMDAEMQGIRQTAADDERRFDLQGLIADARTEKWQSPTGEGYGKIESWWD